MRAQLEQWPHLAGQAYEADRAGLLIMAQGVDAARQTVASGGAVLTLVNACRHLADQLRKSEPVAVEPDDGFEAVLLFEL